MNYRRDSFERDRRRARWTPFLILALIVAFFFFIPSVAERTGRMLVAGSSFIFGSESVVSKGVRSIGVLLADKRSLIEENERLSFEVARLAELATEEAALKEENARLLALMGKEKRTIVASVLLSPNRSPYDTFVVGVGEMDGLTDGAQVFSKGYLLGTVELVEARTARVLLFSAPGRTFSARINGISPVEITGRGGGSFEALVPRGTGIKEGDEVTVPSLERVLIGTVEAVLADPRDPLERLLILSPVSLSDLEYVDIER